MTMQGGQPKKPKSAACGGCGASLATGPKTVIGGVWFCGSCTYKHDHPDKEIEAPTRKRALPIQKEKLFEVPAGRKDRG